MKRLEKAVLIALVFCFALNVLTVERECRRIRKDVLRLHVLANSDSTVDQELKFRVRDAVLEYCSCLTEGDADAGQAARTILDRQADIERVAREVLEAEGCGYDVRVEVGESWFETRSYGDATLPAGTYQAVRVIIGEGKGANWWCVMYPPICVSASSGGAELSDVLDEKEMAVVENGYDVRLWCVEWFSRLAGEGQ